MICRSYNDVGVKFFGFKIFLFSLMIFLLSSRCEGSFFLLSIACFFFSHCRIKACMLMRFFNITGLLLLLQLYHSLQITIEEAGKFDWIRQNIGDVLSASFQVFHFSWCYIQFLTKFTKKNFLA